MVKNSCKYYIGHDDDESEEVDGESVYGDYDKYIKTKILIFKAKKYQKKMHHISVYH